MKYGRRTTSVARQQAAKELADKDESSWTDWLPAAGAGIGAVAAAPLTSGASLAAWKAALPTMIGAAALGGQAGGVVGMLAEGTERPARMGKGAAGLAKLADNPRSAEIIKRVLGGYSDGVSWDYDDSSNLI